MDQVSYQILLPGVAVSSSWGVLGWCSVTLVRTPEWNWLVDTGSYGDRAALTDSLAQAGLTIADIDKIFLSHFHFDHVVNAELFLHSELVLSHREFDYVRRQEFVKGGDPFVPLHLLGDLQDRLTLIDDGHSLGSSLKSVLLPGYTPGNMGLLLTEAKVLIAGDAVKNAGEYRQKKPPPVFHSAEAALQSYARPPSWPRRSFRDMTRLLS